MKKLNKKTISLFISIFLILNIILGYHALATTKTVVDETKKTETTTTTNANGESSTSTKSTDRGEIVGSEAKEATWNGYNMNSVVNNGHQFPEGALTFDDLSGHGDLLCSAHGMPLKGSGAPAYDSITEEVKGSSYDPNDVPDLTPYVTQAYYKKSPGYNTTPEEAFILAFAQCQDAAVYGEYTPAQNAWWNVRGGQMGGGAQGVSLSPVSSAYSSDLTQLAQSTVGNILETTLTGVVDEDVINPYKEYTDLNDIAKDFQKYILKAAKKADASQLEKEENGYFKLDYDPKWIEKENFTYNKKDYDLKNPTVRFEEATKVDTNIEVGYFAVDYVYDPVFSYITNMYIEINDPEHPVLELGKDFVIESEDKTAEEEQANRGMPFSKVPFKIILKNKYNGTKITNIHLDFEYTNSRASYNYFTGQMKDVYTDYKETTEIGENNEVKVKYEWEIKWGTLDSQVLAGDIQADIERFKDSLDRETTRDSKINIKKVIVDEEGKPIDIGEKDFFEFKLTVNGAEQNEAEKIRVKANSSADSKTYTWEKPENKDEAEKAPTFEVKEVNWPSYYDYVSISPDHGDLINGKTINVIATNRLKAQTGTLSIIKKAEKEGLTLVDGDDEFNFTVTITGKFKFNNGEYKEQSVDIPATITADGNPHLVIPEGMIKWYKDNAPSFEVKEKPSESPYVKEVSVVPSMGILTEEGVTVTAINTQLPEKGRVKIIKVLENATDFSREYLDTLVWKFKLNVSGYSEEIITLDKNNIEEILDGDNVVGYQWVGESSDYEWLTGKNPTYEIDEFDLPEGTSFVEDKSQQTGTLVAGDSPETVGVVTNTIVNVHEEKEGKLELTKKIAEKALRDKDFSFVVTVTGTFGYNGEPIKTQTIQLTNNSNNTKGYNELSDPEQYNDTEYVVIHVTEEGSDEANGLYGANKWDSNTIKWFGDAPRYEVKEVLLSDDINHTIAPSSGYLSDTDDTGLVKITAWNGHDKIGYLHISKTLTDAEKCPIDYVEKLQFKFKVHVDGYDDQIITLSADRNEADTGWIWESENLAYSWSFDKEAPKYSIEEIDIPDGVEFDRIDEAHSTITDATEIDQANKRISGQIVENTVLDTNLKVTENAFINKAVEHVGFLRIDKKVTPDGVLKGKEFKFDVTLTGTFTYGSETINNNSYIIKDVVVKGGESVTLGPITWYGPAEGPKYVVKEQPSDIAEVTSMQNDTGIIKEGREEEATVATITNGPTKVGGYLEITKQMDGDFSNDETFKFEVKIGNNPSYVVSLKANEVYKSDYIEWYAAEPAPTYEVKEIEIPETCQLIEITNEKGTLSANNTVQVVAINKETEKSGSFKLTKQIVPSKFIDTAENQEFEFRIRISGTFMIDGTKYYEEDGDYEYTTKISVDVSKTHEASYVSPKITWWGDNAPTVTVEEINLPKGWTEVGSPSNNGASLVENDEIEIVVSNELPVYTEIDLTIELAGQVWEDVRQDSGKNMPDSVPNGKIDSSESGVKGVEVYVYRVASAGSQEITRTLATGYKDNLESPLEFPIITSSAGDWKAPRLEILSMTEAEKSAGATTVRYDVEFVYDGQTYEPTTFLSKMGKNSAGLDAYVEGNASDYINASLEERDKYADKSMAKDYDRDVVNSRITEIYGNTAIDGKGDTVGTVSGAEGTANIQYQANVNESEAKRVNSKLVTTNSDGVAYDLFKATARTSVGGLQYPFDSRMHLENYDITITDKGLKQKYTYSATYNYCLHINLGLVRRTEADVEATKDLYSAKVLVDGKELDYRFNGLKDIGADMLNRHEVIDGMHISYELGLYKTDYYYRAEMYKSNSKLYNAVNNFYKSIGKAIDDSELEVYLTYKLNLYNTSGNYDVAINSINDYYDSSFGAPISEPVSKVVNGELKEVANASYMKVGDTKTNVSWEVTDKNIDSSDGKSYNKMTTNLDGLRLPSGGYAEIYVTFNVRKATIDGVKNAIQIGDKSNIVEIANYSTYYKDGRIAGKIDLDSAPDNVNIKEYNEKTWYEDDTDASPVLNLSLSKDARTISGIAWEDNKVDLTTAVGNGIKDEKEAVIGGLTTELVEKVRVADNEYDFLWPTSESLNCLGGKTLEELAGFASTIETSRGNTDAGEYKFIGVPTGEYVVRFLYGNNKVELEDKTKVTLEPAQALNSDGTSYYVNGNVYTANYDEDKEGALPSVYNGQDYKSTIYQAGENKDTFKNEYHNLNATGENVGGDSDARDSEARRLEVIANSETITNVNGNVLSTANDINEKHTKLYNDYSMFADTAKINLDIESQEKDGKLQGVNSVEVQGTILENGSVKLEKDYKTYNIEKINLGLIERPENVLILDKEINEIKLTTNDNNLIFDAIYNIRYEEANSVSDNDIVIGKIPGTEKYLVAKVELDTERSIGIDQLQAINKNEEEKVNVEKNAGTQNFRFINVDSEILQGTTIEINYLVTALNLSEQDYTSKALANISEIADANNTTIKQEIKKYADTAKTETIDKLGEYIGESYYTGVVNPENETIVTSRVRQIVDYTDNDSVFSSDYNTESNHMWRNTTLTELAGSGFEENRLVDANVIPAFQKVDSKGVQYVVKQKDDSVGNIVQRNNLLLSVDTKGIEDDKSNSGFESELIPYTYNAESETRNYNSQIVLTLTKTVSAQDDANDLTYDNITEIVKLENSVGRRDILTVTGNANPQIGEFNASIKERDASATELITFTPPTGNEVKDTIIAQVLIVIIAGLAIVVTGIVIIKKKVLTK